MSKADSAYTKSIEDQESSNFNSRNSIKELSSINKSNSFHEKNNSSASKQNSNIFSYKKNPDDQIENILENHFEEQFLVSSNPCIINQQIPEKLQDAPNFINKIYNSEHLEKISQGTDELIQVTKEQIDSRNLCDQNTDKKSIKFSQELSNQLEESHLNNSPQKPNLNNDTKVETHKRKNSPENFLSKDQNNNYVESKKNDLNTALNKIKDLMNCEIDLFKNAGVKVMSKRFIKNSKSKNLESEVSLCQNLHDCESRNDRKYSKSTKKANRSQEQIDQANNSCENSPLSVFIKMLKLEKNSKKSEKKILHDIVPNKLIVQNKVIVPKIENLRNLKITQETYSNQFLQKQHYLLSKHDSCSVDLKIDKKSDLSSKSDLSKKRNSNTLGSFLTINTPRSI